MKILCPGQNPVKLNRPVNLTYLKTFFPNATTVTYIDADGDIVGIEFEEDQLMLVDDVNEYEVFIPHTINKGI